VWGRGLTAGGRRRREQVRDLVAAKFGEQDSVPRTWYLLRRRGWTCQLGARRAIERDDGAVGDLGKAHGLKKIQCPPGLVESCLAGTGLTLKPGETPTGTANYRSHLYVGAVALMILIMTRLHGAG